MSEQKTTAADIKKQIEQAKDQMKESGMPLNGQLASEINASEPTPAKVTVKSEPEIPATKGVETAETKESVDLKEWAKKRGIDWTTEDSVLSALRKSDQAFHAKRQVERSREVPVPPAPPPSAYQPQSYPPAPAYAPAPPTHAVLANIARQYNMTVEDAERLMAFNRDFYEVAGRAERERVQRELEVVRRDNEKNTVFRELSSDPVFRQPEVAVEYHKVLDEMQASDPRSFEENPIAYKRAFDIALSNIGRRNLEGRTLQEGVPPAARSLPTNPPKPLGNGSGGSAQEDEQGINAKAFARLSLEDKKATLARMGLTTSY